LRIVTNPKPLHFCVAHDLDTVDSAEQAKQLPENLVIRVRGQIANKQAPAISACGQLTLTLILTLTLTLTNLNSKP